MESSCAVDNIRVAISPLSVVSRQAEYVEGGTNLLATSNREIGLCGGRAILLNVYLAGQDLSGGRVDSV